MERASVSPAGMSHSASGGPNEAPCRVPAVSPQAGALFSALPTEDPDFHEIVEEFVAQLQDRLVAMQQALASQDLPEFAPLGPLAQRRRRNGRVPRLYAARQAPGVGRARPAVRRDRGHRGRAPAIGRADRRRPGSTCSRSGNGFGVYWVT